MKIKALLLRALAAIVLLTIAYVTAPAAWVPHEWRVVAYDWLGASGYRNAPASKKYTLPTPEVICPPDVQGWRQGQTIEGVDIEPAAGCIADNPYLVAAATRGTNQVSQSTLLKSGLMPDTVIMGRDLDGDGDPDEVTIKLEVMELNGQSPDLPVPVTAYAIAPGVEPGMWVFAPKSLGMSTENFESRKANPLLRAPGPTIRVEQGDRVTVVLENSHYLPHTIHFHGVDHPFSADHGMPHHEGSSHAPSKMGMGTDGVAETSEMPAMPGAALTYRFSPRVAGTMFYHCHVQANVHILMGMQGMFVIEDNRPNNWPQTLNIGAGQVRHRAVAVRETYQREYDLHYFDLYKNLSDTIKVHNDPRLTAIDQHRRWNVTRDSANYFLLNGKSFPYTLQDSLIVVKPDERAKLRVLNGGSSNVALHPHGFRPTVTHFDGIPLKPGHEFMRDVIDVAPGQRVDMVLHATDDGLNNSGEGVWLFHDHHEAAQTTDGIYPGGSVASIAFESYVAPNGFPRVNGTDWKQYFTPDFYRKEVPIWLDYDPGGLFADPHSPLRPLVQLMVFGAACMGLLVLVLGPLFMRRRAS